MIDKNESSGHYIKSYDNKNDHYDRSDKIHTAKIQVAPSTSVAKPQNSQTASNQTDKRKEALNNESKKRVTQTPPPYQTTSTSGQQQTPPPPPGNTNMGHRSVQSRPARPNTQNNKKTVDQKPQSKPSPIIITIFAFVIYLLFKACE